MGVRSRQSVQTASATTAQFGLSVSSSVVTLTVPNSANTCRLYVRTAAITFTTDGTAPTATKGIQLDPGDVLDLNSRDELDRLKMIRVASDATVDVEYFTDVSG